MLDAAEREEIATDIAHWRERALWWSRQASEWARLANTGGGVAYLERDYACAGRAYASAHDVADKAELLALELR